MTKLNMITDKPMVPPATAPNAPPVAAPASKPAEHKEPATSPAK